MASKLQIKTKLISESRFDKAKIDGLPRIGQYAVEKIRQNIIDKKITATGRTQGAIGYRIEGEKDLTIFAEKGNRAPIQTLQYGRRAGKMPPLSALKEWIIAKRITVKQIAYKRQPSMKWQPKYTPQERGLNALAGAIGAKIKKSGTDRHQTNDLEVYSPVLDEVIQLFTAFIAKETEKVLIQELMK